MGLSVTLKTLGHPMSIIGDLFIFPPKKYIVRFVFVYFFEVQDLQIGK